MNTVYVDANPSFCYPTDFPKKPTLRTPKRAKRSSKVKEAEAFAVHAELKGREMSEEPGMVGELAPNLIQPEAEHIHTPGR